MRNGSLHHRHGTRATPLPSSILGRAIVRKCPNCGSRGIFRSFLHAHDSCPACRIRLDRGERDFFIGAYTLNLIVAELIVFFGGMAALVAFWPDVPWNGLMWGLAAAMVAGPILLYPWSRQLWLACDLIFRPAEAADFVDSAPAAPTSGPPADKADR